MPKPSAPITAPGTYAASEQTGLMSWLKTVDHKRIGTLYLWTALTFFFVGGIEAFIMRLQLMQPNGQVVSAETFNQLFTMHGTTMVFLVVMPLSAAFFNYLIPLQIGARDVAFPRLNLASWYLYVIGAVFALVSILAGGVDGRIAKANARDPIRSCNSGYRGLGEEELLRPRKSAR